MHNIENTYKERGFPLIGFGLPHECENMSEEEIDKKVKISDKMFCTIRHVNYCNHYVHAVWPQRIMGDKKRIWPFKIWVKVTFEVMDEMKSFEHDKMWKGGVSSVLMWENEEILDHPIVFTYEERLKEMIVVSVKPSNTKIFTNFTLGLSWKVILYLMKHLDNDTDMVEIKSGTVDNKDFNSK